MLWRDVHAVAAPGTRAVTFAVGLEDHLGVCQGNGLETIPVYPEPTVKGPGAALAGRMELAVGAGDWGVGRAKTAAGPSEGSSREAGGLRQQHAICLRTLLATRCFCII